ncbi:hypothetical protein [Microvirga massiliensis]|uniref:hypothetical protein n=1 Tax=Microvirga massiliensis TaxID=1033741 RepID=UPI00062B4147|nr:hypothetical protein [Microvirga massiliensis]
MLQMKQQLGELPTAPQGLSVVRALFTGLHEAGITYCHWKSNEHLEAAVNGLTDLDILIDRHRSEDLQRVLAECGFKRFIAPPLRAYPAIEDYLALDPSSGRLVHLHLHYQLTLGERYLKGYRLPWEARLLATRRFDPEFGIYTADPALELVLLLVRAAFKIRGRDHLRAWSRSYSREAAGDFSQELAWLRRQVDDRTAQETARSLLGDASVEPLRQALATPLDLMPMANFAATIRPALRRHRTYGRQEAWLRAWLREFHCVADAINRRYLHRATPLRRISPRGGTVIVLLGSDGSGKSTLARTLVAWLGVKLDVVPIYLGSGDGPSAIYRLPMRIAHRLLRPLFGPRQPAHSRAEGDRVISASGQGDLWTRIRAAALVPWALALSCEKLGKLRRITRARNRGMIIVCDRFPQDEFPGFNDGPLLAHWLDHPWSICRSLAAWEKRPYAEAALDPPDLVIKLSVTPVVAQARRPEMDLEELYRRVSTVHRLKFPPSTRVVELSADEPVDIVERNAKKIVWGHL